MITSSDENNTALRVLVMGLSKSYGGLPALPGVMPELDAVARDPAVPESHGPLSDFYARWVKAPADGKAEALRQAQLAFLRGPAVSSHTGSDRGVKIAEGSTPAPHDAGYSYPYYWAPFVLIGNYR